MSKGSVEVSAEVQRFVLEVLRLRGAPMFVGVVRGVDGLPIFERPQDISVEMWYGHPTPEGTWVQPLSESEKEYLIQKFGAENMPHFINLGV